MNRVIRLVAVVAGLVLPMHVTPSWGDTGAVFFDFNGNTAGGDPNDLFNGTFSGVGNTAFGADVLVNLTTGSQNTATGASALNSNTTGFNNTATGRGALQENTTGPNNTAIGFSALLSNTTGHSNTASGINALFNNSTGIDNTATGGGSLVGNTTGSKNTAVGVAALNQSNGNKNIGIGFQAGLTLINGNNNIYIGNQGASVESQTIRIGTAQAQTFVAGIANATVGNAATVIIDTTTGQLGIPLSSARYKQDIVPMGSRSEKVLDLRPVTFAYKDDARAITHYGLIAEEVATVYPDLVTRTASGDVQTVKYQELIPMLLNELQRQRHEFQQALQSQQQALQLQQQELAELRALVGQGRGKVVLGGMGE
jgi:Chaperone of endosialidase